jgi:NADP-reducing hydrogenase subunit HndB
MAKLTLEELRKLREVKSLEIRRRESKGKEIQVLVGMGTCGIAAGAKETLEAFLEALDENNLIETVLVRQIGCMGFCKSEPSVEVAVPGMAPVIYGNVNTGMAKEIIASHVMKKQYLDKYIIDRPSVGKGV